MERDETRMNQLEKLQVLLPHWVEHNQGHAEECKKWVDQLEPGDVQKNLKAAVAAMELVTRHLESSLAAVGGPMEDSEHTHHHHH